MIAPKVTPGEWSASEMPALSGGHYKWFEIGPYPGVPVAEVSDSDYPEHSAANVRMMAASKKLAEALNRLSALCAADFGPNYHADIVEAREALLLAGYTEDAALLEERERQK